MVIVLDLDEDALDPAIHFRQSLELPQRPAPSEPNEERHDVPNPNAEAFATALSCYPVVSRIATHLDLNSLHDLSATCRFFHEALVPFRTQLMRSTLRCINDKVDMSSRLADAMRDSQQEMVGANGRVWSGKLTSGRVGMCARDLVGECRRCGVVVCRNCTIKPPPTPALQTRHRRLCKTCNKAPMRHHTVETECLSSARASFTAEAFSRGPCCCPDSVYICLSCGNAMRSADTTYMRGWTWRTRYSTCGGIGAGIGEGNEGVSCGKETTCLAARDVEKEIDCDAGALAELREMEHVSTSKREWGGASYFTQEIEGIGGVFKKKVKKRVKVGAVVKEYEDEREHGDYLRRERTGMNRSWCSWCTRIIPGNKDEAIKNDRGLASVLTSESSSSSVNVLD